jgi:lysozyme
MRLRCPVRQLAGMTETRHPTAEPAAPTAVSEAGVRFISLFEGWRSELYDDDAGHCTIGFGHLVHRGHCDGDSEPGEFRAGITRERGLELLEGGARTAAVAVAQHVRVDLDQCQFNALASFVFNVGAGSFATSTLLKRLNAGDYDAVPDELMRWIYAGGEPLDGLKRRRAAEGRLFTDCDYADHRAIDTVTTVTQSPAVAPRRAPTLRSRK